MSLQFGDAKNVVVIHTNTVGYGFKSSIGPDDKYINGGKKQPNCKGKLTDDICSHNEAWEAYSKYLKDKTFEKIGEKVQIHPFILCLDVSSSMNNSNHRFTRAISSAKQIISNMDAGTYMGIVTFNEAAKTLHGITQTNGATEKNSLISALPKIANGWTSIGGGLRLSMNMLKVMPNGDKFCSTIFLLSDGEQNSGETPQDVLPDLQKACVTVNSIGLGADASNDLEEISAGTDGIVSYAMEDGTSQQIVGITRALSYSFESEMDADDRPIYLPTKQVTLDDGETVIPFLIDESIGKDTEFNFLSYAIDNFDVTLTSPNGQVYTSASPEYSYDYSTQKSFHIESADPGQWNLTIRKSLKRRRSVRSTSDATVMVKTHQLDEKVLTIRLDASVSSRILEYPKSITISAELQSGQFPVICAEVFAHIQGLQTLTRLPLHDNGAFPDDLANDGVYTGIVTKLPSRERYTVLVTASSNGTAQLVQKKINYFLRDVVDCNHFPCKLLTNFEREANVGSIKLLSKDREDEIQPNPIADLRAIVQNKREKQIALEWTSTADENFNIKLKHYDVRALINDTQFEHAFQFNDSHVIRGTLDAINSTAGQVERIVLQIPDHIWNFVKENSVPRHLLKFRFVLKAIGTNDVISERSNIASALVKEQSMTLFVHDNQPSKNFTINKSCKVVRKRTQFGVIRVKLC